jgi:hypothetical protein
MHAKLENRIFVSYNLALNLEISAENGCATYGPHHTGPDIRAQARMS